MADDFRPRLLRGRDDARRSRALRHRPLRHVVSSKPAPVRSDDRGGHALQQDGARAAQGLRPDARAALGAFDGVVRQWRRLLPLQLFRGARLRPHRAGGRLRAGLPSDSRGAALRNHPAAAEDPSHQHDRPGLRTSETR
ncbi:NADH-quinone oxidoreductase [Burkholderiales bacterium 8X]|nr:NADH-quinone oxidoreductase [Burkholderiales bacterium 8X]